MYPTLNHFLLPRIQFFFFSSIQPHHSLRYYLTPYYIQYFVNCNCSYSQFHNPLISESHHISLYRFLNPFFATFFYPFSYLFYPFYLFCLTLIFSSFLSKFLNLVNNHHYPHYSNIYLQNLINMYYHLNPYANLDWTHLHHPQNFIYHWTPPHFLLFFYFYLLIFSILAPRLLCKPLKQPVLYFLTQSLESFFVPPPFSSFTPQATPSPQFISIKPPHISIFLNHFFCFHRADLKLDCSLLLLLNLQSCSPCFQQYLSFRCIDLSKHPKSLLYLCPVSLRIKVVVLRFSVPS